MNADKTCIIVGPGPDYFPSKLWRLVNDPGIQSIYWDTRGEGIVIDEDRFKAEVLFSSDQSKYFKTKDFVSVIRQLNLYGFRKVRTNPDILEKELRKAFIISQLHHFHHPNFKRANPERLVNIKRLTRSNKSKLASGLAVPSYFRQPPLNIAQEEPGSNLGEYPRFPNHNSNGLQTFPMHHGGQQSVSFPSLTTTSYACLPGPMNPSVTAPDRRPSFYIPVYQCASPNSTMSSQQLASPIYSESFFECSFRYYQSNGQNPNMQTVVPTNLTEWPEMQAVPPVHTLTDDQLFATLQDIFF